MVKSKSPVVRSDLSEADIGRLMIHATGLFHKSGQDEFSRVLLGTYCVTIVRLTQGDLVTTAVMMEYDPSHLNTVSRRASKLVNLGLLERGKIINDNKRYEIVFTVPETLLEKLRRGRSK